MQKGGNPDLQNQKKQFQYNLLHNMKGYMEKKLYKNLNSDFYSVYSIIPDNDIDRQRFSKIFNQMTQSKNFNPQKLKLSFKQSRAIASVLGMGICDALGASTQFMAFDKQGYGLIQNGFADLQNLINQKVLSPRSGKVGIWTDDASMGLAMAYSIILNNFKFDPIHMRYMFILWLEQGLGNGGRPHSIGLGGNISISMGQFMKQQTPYAQKGNQFNNGNGSLMRLAPVPIAYLNNVNDAVKYSGLQSLTTHNGLQAQACSELMALILVRLVHRGENQNWREVLQKACKQFKTQILQVKYLAQSKQETQQMFLSKAQKYGKSFLQFNKSPDDRNWNWKDANFTYSPRRLKQQPGYIGSYCMDALSMALHTVWHTKDFKQCALINANFGGDCDTVGSIAGQIAGAIYGIDDKMLELYSEMVDWKSRRFEVFLIGYKLASKSLSSNDQEQKSEKMQVQNDAKSQTTYESQQHNPIC